MTYIAPRTEALARAMCLALGRNPDEPIYGTPRGEQVSYRWLGYCWKAELWIYEHSGGELPEREGEGRG